MQPDIPLVSSMQLWKAFSHLLSLCCPHPTSSHFSELRYTFSPCCTHEVKGFFFIVTGVELCRGRKGSGCMFLPYWHLMLLKVAAATSSLNGSQWQTHWFLLLFAAPGSCSRDLLASCYLHFWLTRTVNAFCVLCRAQFGNRISRLVVWYQLILVLCKATHIMNSHRYWVNWVLGGICLIVMEWEAGNVCCNSYLLGHHFIFITLRLIYKTLRRYFEIIHSCTEKCSPAIPIWVLSKAFSYWLVHLWHWAVVHWKIVLILCLHRRYCSSSKYTFPSGYSHFNLFLALCG